MNDSAKPIGEVTSSIETKFGILDMSQKFNTPEDILSQPVFRESAFEILRGILAAQARTLGREAPLDGAVAIQAMAFVTALLIEANPACRTQQDLRQVAETQHAWLRQMLRQLRNHHSETGEHLLERIGKLMPTLN